MARLAFHQVRKTYPGALVAADGVDLAVDSGELLVIVGPSGSGKSTLLRLVAGLEKLDSGSITLDGEPIDGLAPRDRGVAMVFQGQVLYPHLSVFENLAFGLRARKHPLAEIDPAVRAVAESLGVADCLDRRPATLSGGQRQRVALGRALVLRPRVFLLDEPFSGLDAPLRALLRAELAELQRRLGVTMILVTHDQAEAMALGDRVAVLDQGRLIQVGPPQAVYDRPANRFVARFLGHPPMNILPCLVARQGDALRAQILGLEGLGPKLIPATTPGLAPVFAHAVPRLDVGLRAEHISLRPATADQPGQASVVRLEPSGSRTMATFHLGPYRLTAWVNPRSPIQVGDPVHPTLDWSEACWFDPQTGNRV